MLDNFDGQRDGTNAFIFSRFLVPSLMGFEGWAMFVDGDMVVTDDIKELWDLRDDRYAVMVVKHDYKTRHSRKYIGSPLENDNVDYPRKNWSSVVLWNCGHPANRLLTPDYVAGAEGRFLHRFEWLNDEQIGELPMWWNHLVGEYPPGPAKLYHYTLGVAGMKYYADVPSSWHWHKSFLTSLTINGENRTEMVRRSQERICGI